MKYLAMRASACCFLVASLLAGCGDSRQAATPPASALSPQAATIASISTRSYAAGVYVETGADSIPAQVYRLYRAAFAREADAQGLGYQVGVIEVYGHTLAEIAAAFVASPEFKNTYGNID